MTRINPVNHKQTITINLATSHINDYARVASAARRIAKSSYHRYGSTIDFYVPRSFNKLIYIQIRHIKINC